MAGMHYKNGMPGKIMVSDIKAMPWVLSRNRLARHVPVTYMHRVEMCHIRG